MAHVNSAAEATPRSRMEVDVGSASPASLTGLRRVLTALKADAPEAFAASLQRHPSEWNALFPGSVEAPDLFELALTPSERRLHRESEQMFRVLNVAARAILDALATSGKVLVVRNAGACDLLTLRCLMRTVEWGRLESLDRQIRFEGWAARRAIASELFAERRVRYLEEIRTRLRIDGDAEGGLVSGEPEPGADDEGRHLSIVLDSGRAPEARVAAAVLAIRAAFFTTNYEVALLAAEQALSVLDQTGAGFDPAEVYRNWDLLDSGFTSPAIEIDRNSLGDAETLRALFYRCIGVVRSFLGGFEDALAAFAQGLERNVAPEQHAHLRMFRALTLIKRMGQTQNARTEIEAGLSALGRSKAENASLHEGWLRNVLALTWFQEKQLQTAMQEEKRAILCVGDLHDASATHLKINLISNISVLQETAKTFPEAIATWRRFEKISDKWGENFFKHHRYRLSGLQLAAGDRDSAWRGYTEAYASAERLKDSLHRQVISAELGQMALAGGDRDEAVHWFDRAVQHSGEIGEPFRLAQSLAGQALARNEPDLSGVVRAAEATSTYPKEGRALVEAANAGATDRLEALLPRPKSKLNRPFDQINL